MLRIRGEEEDYFRLSAPLSVCNSTTVACTTSKLNIKSPLVTKRNTKQWSSCFKACQVAALNKGCLTVLFPTLPKYKQKLKGTLSVGHIDM